MPKAKAVEPKEEEKIIDPDLMLGDEIIPGDVIDPEDEDEDASLLDDEEVDPFKDKWEE